MSDEVRPNATRRLELGDAVAFEVTLDALALRVLSGDDVDHQETLALHRVRIGSASENDFQLRDATVSRHHAELRVEGEALVLTDLGSTNGTWVDGVKIREVEVTPGQEVRLGEARLEVRAARTTRSARVRPRDRLGPLVGRSQAMGELFSMLEAAAPTPATVMVQGESGTGKELVARCLHELSGRGGPLVTFDAASTDPQMVRSDLFGHEKGSYTGAAGAREGAFRRAEGGTLFLDEIGELPLDLQPRLLRVLESRTVTPLGSDRSLPVDVRVVSATHRDLKRMVAEGTFRRDLYHRLAIVRVSMPPLRDRLDDVPLLVDHLQQALGLELRLDDAARLALATHPWPGNVRELRNELERLGALYRDRTITADDLDLELPAEVAAAPVVVDTQKLEIEAALARNRGNKAATARDLGMSLSTLKRRCKEYGF